MPCNGMGALPPATLFEITLGKGKDQDYYDVSLVDGYNLPIYATPTGQQGSCNATGCASDLNSSNSSSSTSFPFAVATINPRNTSSYNQNY